MVQWPLLGATVFMYWLQIKYEKDQMGKSYNLLDSFKIIDVKHNLIALPTRTIENIAFVQEKGIVSLYNLTNATFIHKDLKIKLMPMSAFFYQDLWLIWAKNRAIILDQDLQQLECFDLKNSGISLVFERENILYFATTNEVLFSYDKGELSSVDTCGIAYQYDPEGDYFLTSQGIIYKMIEGSFQKQNEYSKEVLSASVSNDQIFMYKSNSKILKKSEKGLSELANYHKEFGFPEIIDGYLYFVNTQKELIQMDERSMAKVLKTYDQSPFIHRKIGNYLLLLFEVGKSTRIEIFDYKSQKCFSFVKEGYFNPLGLSELSFDFSFNMSNYYSWKWGEDQPVESQETLTQVLHFDQKKYFLKKAIWSTEDGKELRGLKTKELEINFDFQKVGMIPATV